MKPATSYFINCLFVDLCEGNLIMISGTELVISKMLIHKHIYVCVYRYNEIHQKCTLIEIFMIHSGNFHKILYYLYVCHNCHSTKDNHVYVYSFIYFDVII